MVNGEKQEDPEELTSGDFANAGAGISVSPLHKCLACSSLRSYERACVQPCCTCQLWPDGDCPTYCNLWLRQLV